MSNNKILHLIGLIVVILIVAAILRFVLNMAMRLIGSIVGLAILVLAVYVVYRLFIKKGGR